MTVIVNCPNLGITTRTGPAGLTGITALRGHKVPYGHISNTFVIPSWLGGNSKVDSVGQWGRGDMKARYVRDGGDALGRFSPIAKNIAAPSASPISLQVKESVGEAVYAWMRQMDLDIRYQSCGRVDDPTNWDAIKRLCECLVTDMSTSGETSYAPSDEGETMIKVQLTSANAPMIIYPVTEAEARLYEETRFADYDYVPIVTAGPNNSYVVPAISGAVFLVAYGDDVKDLTSGTALLPYNPVSISSHDNIVVAVLSDGSVYWSNDYGKTFYLSTGVMAAVTVKVWNHSNILVGASGGIYSDSTVFQSADGGRTFEAVDPYNAVTGDAVGFAYRDGKVVYALDSNSMVSVSEDNGETFVRTSAVPISRPTSMVVLGNMIIVGGYASNVPVIVGSEDGGYTWYVLARIQGGDVFPVGFPVGRVSLAVEGCGVVTAAITYANGGAVYSDVYRNVNWGAAGAWERIWQDAANAEAYNGFIMITDIASACVNDLLAVGWIMGVTPLYTGIKFSSVG